MEPQDQTDRDRQARDIFLRALEIHPPEARAAYLEGTCQHDASLRSRVDTLMACHEEDTFLENAAVAGPPAVLIQAPLLEGPGAKIGRYKLLQQIGEGGCGTVFMAEQEEPVRRRVALKVIKLGMDTKSVIARFEAERQALAMMDHPNIAKVLDAGATDSGRPFFVMELVKGIPITRFCDEAKLSTQQRLDLFVPVCQAIQHAHQKGIIHRDIKPSNILVTLHDAVPVPKVIDFGIAKATEGRLTDATLFTAFEQFVGTPAYMSPEQAQLSGLDIDTRSDIYSLGVLLYELLTGRTPFDAKELMAAGLDAMRRTIREVEPPRPSTRVSTLQGDALTATAQAHGTDAVKLAGLIRGDLDWIVMKCLEKDRTRRYETASGVMADVQRHLNNEPITARPPSAVYRFQKAVRRNRAAFAGVTVIALVLVLATVFSSWQAARATRARNLEVRANERLRVQIGETERAKHAAEQATQAETQQRERSEFALQSLQIQKAEDLLQRNQSGLAASYLGQVLRSNPSNLTAAARFVSVLTRPFCQSPLEPLRHEGGGLSAEFSPDGQRVVIASGDKTARVWDARTGQPLAEPLRHEDRMASAHFSPDGLRVVTASADKTARVWDARTGQQLIEPLRHQGEVNSAEFSPDGMQVVTASEEGAARIWDSRTGQLLTEPLRHGSRVNCAKFSPDGSRVVTASEDKTAQVWDARTGQRLAGPLRHEDEVIRAAFSPGGWRVVTTSWDKTARVWDARTGQPMAEPLRHGKEVNFAEFSPDGTWVVTCGESNAAQIWDSWTGQPMGEPLRHEAWVVSAAFSPDGRRVITSSWDGTARIWDAVTCQPLTEPLRHESIVWSARFSPDGQQVVTSSNDQTARIWETQTSQPLGEPLSREIRGRIFSFSPEGQRLAGVGFGEATRVWNLSTGKLLAETASDQETARLVQFSPDGLQLITASEDQTVRVWDAHTGQPLSEPLRQPGKVLCAQFGAAGPRVVILTDDRKVRVCEARTGRPVGEPLRHPGGVGFAVLSPDNSRVATASGNSARVWDAQTGEPLTAELRHEHVIRFVRFSPDGRLLVTGSHDRTARIWDAQTGLALGEPLTHERWLNAAAFSPDSQWVVTGSEDQTARVWNARTGQPLSGPFRHEHAVYTVEFTPDGSRVLTASGRDTVLLWEATPAPVPVPDWFIDWAETRVGRRFAPGSEGGAVPLTEQRRQWERVAARADTDFYTRIAQWAQADPATRPVSPHARVTVPEYVQRRIDDNTVTTLREAVRLVPTNGPAGFRLAVHELIRSSEMNPGLLLEPEFGANVIWRSYPTNLLLSSCVEELRKSVAAEPFDMVRSKHLATVYLWLGETNEHRTLCRKSLELTASLEYPPSHERAAKAYLILASPEPETLKLAVNAGRLALKALDTNDVDRPWFLVTAAMAGVRDGKPAEAEPLLDEVLNSGDGHRVRRGLAFAYRSLARARLGRIPEARADFAELEKLLPAFPGRPALSPILLLPDSMALALAHEEIKGLLASTQPANP